MPSPSRRRATPTVQANDQQHHQDYDLLPTGQEQDNSFVQEQLRGPLGPEGVGPERTPAGGEEEGEGGLDTVDPTKTDAVGGGGGGDGEGPPPGDETKMEPEVKAQTPQTEGTEEETKNAADGDKSAEEIGAVTENEGPGEEEAPEVQGGEEDSAGLTDAAPETPAVDVPAPQGPGLGVGPSLNPADAVASVDNVSYGDISLEANGIDASKLPPEAIEQVYGILSEMRAQNAEAAAGFLSARQGDSAGLAGMANEVTGRIQGAAGEASAQVAAAAETQKATVAAAVASARGQIAAQAESSRAAVSGQLSAALASIAASTEGAKATLLSDKSAASGQVDAAEAAQRAAIEAAYASADQRYRAVGVQVGAEALARAESRASGYLSQKINRDDSFLDGPVTDNKCEARATAAREVGKGYQKGLQDEAIKQAEAAKANKARDLEGVASAAQAARTQLETHYTSMVAQLDQSAAASTQAANQSAAGLMTAIDTSLASGNSALDAHQSSQIAALDGAASQAQAGIQGQAAQAISGINGGITSALTDLDAALGRVSEALGTPSIPGPEEFAASLGEAGASFQQTLDFAKDSIRSGIDGAVAGLMQSASGAVAGLNATGAGAAQVAGETAAQLVAQLQGLDQQAAQTFQQVTSGHDQGVAATVESAKTGYQSIVDGLNQGYSAIAQQLTAGMETNVNALRDGLRGSFGDMDTKINTEAEKAAAKVQPRWKSVLKWICIIAVIVVVALVLGPLVIGAVGGVLGSGMLATVVGGAIVGAISGAATTLITNAFDGNPLTEGLLQATLLGALGGGLGAGLGAVASNVASKGGTIAVSALKEFGIAVGVDMVVDTTINALTGQLTWENFAQSLISSVIMNGATTHPRIKGITEHFTAVGTDFGKGLRPNVTPTPTPTPTPQVDETPAPTVQEPTVREPTVQEPRVTEPVTPQVDETPATPVAETTTRTPETTTPDTSTIPETKVDTTPAVDETVATPETKPIVDETVATPETKPIVDETVATPETKPVVDETTTTPETKPVVDETTTTQVDETVAVVDETTTKTPATGDETPTTTRQPSAELQTKANDVLKQINDANASVTDPKVKAANEAAAKKIDQILNEQAPGVTDALKVRFMDELAAQIANPANAGKDMFTLIRDTVNAASVKDANGQTQNPYLKQGEAIPLSALQDAGNMSRLYGTDKVFNMLTPQAKADLTAAGVTKDTFGTFLANNPNYDLRVNLDPKAFVEGYNDVAWWGLQSEGVATNVTELIDALALNPEYYQQGGIRFNATPETMAQAGVTKPTAFDGMFPEWVPTDVDNPFGVTGGGKQEGVAPRIEVKDIGQIEVFAGTPDQLVTGRGSPLKETFTNAGDTNGAALVDGVMTSSASNDVKARFLKEFEAQVKANPGKSSQDVYNDVLSSNPDFAAVSPATTNPITTPDTNKLSGKELALTKGYPEAPEGYHWAASSKGEPYLRRNPGNSQENYPKLRYDNTNKEFIDTKTGQTFKTPAEVEALVNVQNTAKGSRPDPVDYIPSDKMAAHLEKFKDGASYLVPKDVLDRFGRDKLGWPDNSQFVMTKAELDGVLAKANGDISIIEQELGIPAGTWAGREMVRIDIPAPEDLNVRMPSGNEDGANPLWIPGGKLPTGYNEAVVNNILSGDYVETLVIGGGP